mmetsp:Transcript_5158/g.11174  ORF Transcript_5158/g.11174 Transcript_5158/m.11174 type:complete len:280 (+) Transcript_5158:31-870(+)
MACYLLFDHLLSLNLRLGPLIFDPWSITQLVARGFSGWMVRTGTATASSAIRPRNGDTQSDRGPLRAHISEEQSSERTDCRGRPIPPPFVLLVAPSHPASKQCFRQPISFFWGGPSAGPRQHDVPLVPRPPKICAIARSPLATYWRRTAGAGPVRFARPNPRVHRPVGGRHQERPPKRAARPTPARSPGGRRAGRRSRQGTPDQAGRGTHLSYPTTSHHHRPQCRRAHQGLDHQPEVEVSWQGVGRGLCDGGLLPASGSQNHSPLLETDTPEHHANQGR